MPDGTLPEALGPLVSPSGASPVQGVQMASRSGLNISTADQSPFLRAGAFRLLAQYTAMLTQVRDPHLLGIVIELIGDQLAQDPSRVVVAHPGPPQAGMLAQGAASFDVQHKRDGSKVINLEGILVDPASQGRQVGTELMQAVWDIGTSEGATRMVLRSIPSAVGFYERLGGEVRGSTGEFVEIHFNRRPG